MEFGSGGGITYDSVAADEDDELESKTEVLRRARPEFQLFETLRVDEKGVHHLAMHLRRLAGSAAYFGFLCDTDVIARAVMALQPSSQPCRLRIRLHRDGRTSLETSLLVDAPSPVRLALGCTPVRSDDPFLCHKTTRRDVYDAARAAHPDADDVVLVNERDEIVETTIANLLYRLGTQWFTPPLTSGGLAGIGREVLLTYGVVSERVLHREELMACDALEVVSSLRGRRPAAMLQR